MKGAPPGGVPRHGWVGAVHPAFMPAGQPRPRLARAGKRRNLGGPNRGKVWRGNVCDMNTFLFWFFVVILLAAASFAGWWAYRVYVLGETGSGLGNWFGPRPEPRLGVTEQASVDSRRRLVLVRRDDVEHLIMTGGPVDVVIETNIAVRHAPHTEQVEASPPVFSRQSRAFGQAVNE
jgi:flagellar protein FliO/FliZ